MRGFHSLNLPHHFHVSLQHQRYLHLQVRISLTDYLEKYLVVGNGYLIQFLLSHICWDALQRIHLELNSLLLLCECIEVPLLDFVKLIESVLNKKQDISERELASLDQLKIDLLLHAELLDKLRLDSFSNLLG